MPAGEAYRRVESQIHRSCSSLSAAYRPRFMPVEGLVSQISPRPSFTRRRPRSRGNCIRPDKGNAREPALSRRAYIVLTKKSPSDIERRDEIKPEGRAGAGRKVDVRMQLITTAVFAVGKILRIRIERWGDSPSLQPAGVRV